MNNNIIIITIICIIGFLIFIFFNNDIVKNHGKLNIENNTYDETYDEKYPYNNINNNINNNTDKNFLQKNINENENINKNENINENINKNEDINLENNKQLKPNTDVLPYPQISNNYTEQNVLNNILNKKDSIKPQELLPIDDPYNEWQMTSPSVNGHLSDRNFLESGHHFGIDTVSNTLKNPNYQLRSDPLIPQIPVGPWAQSTYGPDTNRRQFDIGGDY